MPASFIVRCPHCQGKLKLKSRAVIGKKAPCPECNKMFLIKPPPEPEEDWDDMEAGNGADDFTPPPSARRPGHAGPRLRGRRPRRSAKDRWARPTLIICGSVLGIALLVGGVLLAFTLFKKSSPSDSELLAYVPSKCEIVMFMNVDQMADSAMWNELTMNNNQIFNLTSDRILKSIGIESISQIETIAAGLNDADDLSTPGQSFPAVMVVRAKKDLLQTKIKGQSTREIHNGTTYYREGPVSSFFPDSRTWVAARNSTIRDVIDGVADSETAARFSFADFDQQFVFAYKPRSGVILAPEARRVPPGAPPFVAKLVNSLNNVRMLSISGVFSDELRITARAGCRSSPGAAGVKASIEVALSELKKVLQIAAAAANSQQARILTDVLDSIQCSVDGSTVVAIGSISQSQIEVLQLLGGGSPFGGAARRP